jgi:aminoglycoside-2''-adenylyltransferase
MATHIPPAIAKIAPDGNLTPRQARHFMINLLKRRVRSGTGSSQEFLQRRTAMNPWPDLRPILNEIKWVIVGGVATRAYMPERMTKDLDILVHQNNKDTVLAKLQQTGYQIIEQLAIPGYSLRSPEGIEVDVLFRNDTWLKDALNQPAYDSAGYPVIRLPYLILLKMDAQRAQDWADVSRMLGLASDTELDRVRAVVAQYTPEDSEDLESLIFIGKQENNS